VLDALADDMTKENAPLTGRALIQAGAREVREVQEAQEARK